MRSFSFFCIFAVEIIIYMAFVPNEYFKAKGLLYHVLGGSIFVFGLFLLFCPFGFKFFDLTYERYSFHVTMVFCILLVTLLISRLSIYFSRSSGTGFFGSSGMENILGGLPSFRI